jgi:hypothetical protein
MCSSKFCDHIQTKKHHEVQMSACKGILQEIFLLPNNSK